MSKTVRKIVLSFLFLLGVSWLHITNEITTTLEVEAGTQENYFYLPRVEFVKPVLFGHEGLAADLIWIRTLGYFADEVRSGHKFTYLDGLIGLATDLDPRFEKIYIWAGAIYMYKGGSIRKEHILASNRVLKKGWQAIQSDPDGWRHDPSYWMIPQMIGFNYAIELRDRKKGAPYIAEVARIPGAPELYKTWAATLYKKSGMMEEGTQVLEDMLAVETLESQLASVKNKGLKRRIENRLALYYERIYSPKESRRRVRLLMERIESLVKNWRQEYPYISFRQYLVLTMESRATELNEGHRIWSNLFSITNVL